MLTSQNNEWISVFLLIKTAEMKKNVGSIDRVIRFSLAAVLVALYFFGVVGGVLGWVVLGLAGVFLLTGLVSFCPLYAPFGLTTCRD